MKYKPVINILITICSLLSSTVVLCQSSKLQWAKNAGGVSMDNGMAVATDKSGNLYTSGYFGGTADFDPDTSKTYFLTSKGAYDIFITKFDSSGNFIWAKSMGSVSNDYSYSLAVDDANNIFMTGSFQDTVDFDPGPGVYNLISGGQVDVFILKLNASGNLVWAKRIGGKSWESGKSITLDAASNIYTTGYYSDTVDFDMGSGIFNMIGNWNESIYIAKYDSAGHFFWAKSIGTTGSDEGRSITLDAAGNVYTAGICNNNVDFDPGPGVTIINGDASTDAFVLKLTNSGNFIWARRWGSTNNEQVSAIAVDAIGNSYTTGYFVWLADFDPSIFSAFLMSTGGDRDAFIEKLDSSGNFVWAKQLGGPGSDLGNAVALDKTGNIYSCGSFEVNADFDPGSGNAIFRSSGFSDAFISKLDSGGNIVWAKKIGGNGYDQANAISVDATGNIYACGQFSGTVDFESGSGVYNLKGNIYDIFTLKMGNCQPTYSTQTIEACDTFVYNGINILKSGHYIQYLTNKFGCDSIIHINLIVKKKSTSNVVIYACDSFIFNNIKFKASGVSIHKLVNSVGCDSIVTLYLNIGHPSITGTTKTSCGSYVWNGQTYVNSGLYTQKLTNIFGCDSIVNLTLSIKNNSNSAFSQTSCNSCRINNVVYTNSGIYTQTIPNAIGCDSVLTLNLTINKVNTNVNVLGHSLSVPANAAFYQWVKCPSYSIISGATSNSYAPVSDGDYAVIVSQNNCVDTSACTKVTGVGLENRFPCSSMKASPNPSDGLFIVVLSDPPTNCQMEIYNCLGVLVYKQNEINEKNLIDLTNLNGGIYFLQLINDTNIFWKERIILVR